MFLTALRPRLDLLLHWVRLRHWLRLFLMVQPLRRDLRFLLRLMFHSDRLRLMVRLRHLLRQFHLDLLLRKDRLCLWDQLYHSVLMCHLALRLLTVRPLRTDLQPHWDLQFQLGHLAR